MLPAMGGAPSKGPAVVEAEGSPTQAVRCTTQWVAQRARDVHVDGSAAQRLVDSLSDAEMDSMLHHEWDEGKASTAALRLMLDAFSDSESRTQMPCGTHSATQDMDQSTWNSLLRSDLWT